MARYKVEKDTIDHQDAINAFVAMGGNEDSTGQIETQKLVQIAQEFELTIDINVPPPHQPLGANRQTGRGQIRMDRLRRI